MNTKNIIMLLSVCFCILFSNQVTSRNISPLPHNLADITQYRDQIGAVYYFYVTGQETGGIWGTGIYTDDTEIAVAAVHAGLLAADQVGVIKVTIQAGQTSYSGSTAHNVTSANYNSWEGSYSVATDDGGDNPVLADPGNLTAFRDVLGGVYHFNVIADEENKGLWGSNVYSDDSALAKVAIHTGVLRLGESGTVRVVIVPEQESYIASHYNTINSSSFSAWNGSYAVSNVSGNTALIPYPGSFSLPLTGFYNLAAFRDTVGAAFHFTVTGENNTSIWGAGIYTDDSSLAVSAVHAGIIGLDQTATVKVSILAGQSSYNSSTAFGITSSTYGEWGGSYSLHTADGGNGAIPDINSALSASITSEQSFFYQITAGDHPTGFNATGLPEGLSVDSNGLISGTSKVNGHFNINLLAMNALGVDMAELSLTVGEGAEAVSTASCIFHWAEQSYPEFFSPASLETLEFAGYTYRYYSATDSYLALHTDGNIYVLIPIFGTQIINVGSINDFRALSGC
ncbi:MAG: hypothetical protein GQ582_06430 [Methyloprofundus sp.]|nr:hypothetical protein [Methyloprofundus sp.]